MERESFRLSYAIHPPRRQRKYSGVPASFLDQEDGVIHIDRALVKRLISDQFPRWASLPLYAVEPGGWDNRTFRLGDAMSVRLPSAERYSAQVHKEHQWLPKLSPLLPLPIPVPLAKGRPQQEYPWHWSVYEWLDGESAAVGWIENKHQFAMTLANFLIALQQINPEGGPIPGQDNFFRGGDLSEYDLETREAISTHHPEFDARVLTEIWETALGSRWQGPPCWFHGDMSAGNLLVRGGALYAVIDFGMQAWVIPHAT
jgi:aminoglycoside phosphotransferase (APT) family kinase protein